MKIVLVSDWFLPRLGGVELQLRDLAGELTSAGHQVHVVTTTPADPRAQGSLQTGLVALPDGVSVHRLDVPLLPGLGITLSQRAGPAMKGLLRTLEPDVVHIHASICSTAALAAAWAADGLGLPIVVTFHSVLGVHRHLLRGFDVALGWSRWPHVFSAVSGALASEVAWLAPGRTVEVLPNGLNPADWRTVPVPGVRDELRLVSVLRLQARKRGTALLRVVAAAAKRLEGTRQVRLTVIGDGPERRRMETEARRLRIASAVEFTGYLPRPAIREHFARADVFVLVSVLDPSGSRRSRRVPTGGGAAGHRHGFAVGAGQGRSAGGIRRGRRGCVGATGSGRGPVGADRSQQPGSGAGSELDPHCGPSPGAL